MLCGRLLQGFSAGAELGGVSVYLAEIATPGRKGFYTSWQSGSQQVAIMVAAAMGFALNAALEESAIREWGWRIPFLFGCLIVPFIFILRRKLEETQEFTARRHHLAMRDVFKTLLKNWPVVIAGMLMVAMTTTAFYLITVYAPTFGKRCCYSALPTACWSPFWWRSPTSSGCPSAARCRTVSAANRCWSP